MKYLGWIPNLRGRLSFKLVGSSFGPYTSIKNKNFNTGSTVCCANIVGNIRCLHDSAMPRVFRKLFFRNWIAQRCWQFIIWALRQSDTTFGHVVNDLLFTTGDYYFIFFSSDKNFLSSDLTTSDYESFKGKVYIIPVEKMETDSKEFEGLGWLNIEERVIDLISEASSLTSGDEKQCKSIVSELENTFFNASLCGIEFTIHRDGFLFLKNKTTHFSIFENQKAEQDSELYNQAYYFLKDLTHEHQHHHSRTDSILEVKHYPLSKADNECVKEYSDYTLKRLYRHVLNRKRKTSLPVLYSIKGFLSYISAYRHIVKERLGAGGDGILKKYCEKADGRIMESCEARISEENHKFQRQDVNKSHYAAHIAKVVAFSSLFLALMAFSLTYISLAVLTIRQTVNENSGLTASGIPDNFHLEFAANYLVFATRIVSEPITILVGILILAFMAIFQYKRKIDNLVDKTKVKRFLNDLVRLAFTARNRAASMTFYYVLSGSLLFFYLYSITKILLKLLYET